MLDGKAGAELSAQEKALLDKSREVYKHRLDLGIAREQARKDLPLSTYTEAYWKIDLGNLLRFLHLRMETNAQLEIRNYAKTIGYEIVSRWCPLAWEAFLDYRFHGLSLSRQEMELIQAVASSNMDLARELADKFELLNHTDDGVKPNLEGREIEEKLKQMNLPVPW